MAIRPGTGSDWALNHAVSVVHEEADAVELMRRLAARCATRAPRVAAKLERDTEALTHESKNTRRAAQMQKLRDAGTDEGSKLAYHMGTKHSPSVEATVRKIHPT